MNRKKLLILGLIISTFVGLIAFVSAYEDSSKGSGGDSGGNSGGGGGSGPGPGMVIESPSADACTNGDDDDGDNLEDGNDPGCVKPYEEDNTESNVYDLDASWIFSGLAAPSSTGPSIFHGEQVVKRGGSTEIFQDSKISSSEIREKYVKKSHVTWGGGIIEKKTSPAGDGVVNHEGTGNYQLVDKPGMKKCGNAVEESGETTKNCPTDKGLPGDVSTGSTKSITKTRKTYDSETMGFGPSDEDTRDELKNKFDLEIRENDDDYNIDISGTGSHRDKLIPEVDKWVEVPDFYLQDSNSDGIYDQIWMFAAKIAQVYADSVTDYDLIDKTTTHFKLSGTAPTGCSGISGNYTCKPTGDSVCTATSEDYVTWEKLKKDQTKTFNYDTKEYTTTGTKDSVNKKTSSLGFKITVKYDEKNSNANEKVKSFDCSTWSSVKSCDSTGPGGSCTTETSDVYSGINKNYKKWDNGETISLGYENVKFRRLEIFDLFRPSNPNDGIGDIKPILWDEDFSATGISLSDIVHNNFGERTYWSRKWSFDSNFLGNDQAVSSSAFGIKVQSDRFFSKRTFSNTWDADGPQGKGDGFVTLLEEGSLKGVTDSTNNLLRQEVQVSNNPTDIVGPGDLENWYFKDSNSIGSGSLDCPGSFTHCVSASDIRLRNLPKWSNPRNPGDKQDFRFDFSTKDTEQSMSVCEMYQDIDPDSELKSRYLTKDSPTKTEDMCVGDHSDEYWVMMEGTEVEESAVNDHPANFEAKVDSPTDCNLRGVEVSEGTVADVSNNEYPDYEAGKRSPDWEVCLNKDQQNPARNGENFGDDSTLDNYDYDNDGEDEEVGGEWFDLDSEEATEYLRGPGNGLVQADSSSAANVRSAEIDSNGDGKINSSDIDYYWRYNPNPPHAEYNPTGGEQGLTLEDDCDSDLEGCDDTRDDVLRDGSGNYFYGWFDDVIPSARRDLARDEDYHPKGRNEDISTKPHRFFGYLKKIKDDSNQLEPGMETQFPMSVVGKWSNSVATVNDADQFGIVDNRTEALSNRGNSREPSTGRSFEPGRTYYRDASERRGNLGSPTVSKLDKVYGNSLVVVSNDNNPKFRKGEGYWIDPDEIRTRKKQYRGGWRSLVNFNIDLTGRDSGLGFDDGITHRDQSNYLTNSLGIPWRVVEGGVYWEGEGSPGPSAQGSVPAPSQTSKFLEPPMCGDDQREFFLEEAGESVNSIRFNGRYACADARNVCPNFGDPAVSQNQRLFTVGEYVNAAEPDEDIGRLKNDGEVCKYDYPDEQPKWYDQDYGDVDGDGTQDTCRVNTLYGVIGKRWIDVNQINTNPHAFTGGIDDDWNGYLENEHDKGQMSGFFVSKPWKNSWSGGESPVPTGSNNRTKPNSNGVDRDEQERKIDTKGFCAGDDSSEYIITQRCSTELCSTDTSYLGVANGPDKCLLEEDASKKNGVDVDGGKDGLRNRDIYDEGEKVKVDTSSGEELMACYDGSWYAKWPVKFLKDSVRAPLGGRDRVTFSVLNVEDEQSTFDLKLSEPQEIDPYVVFSKTGSDKMNVTLEAVQSRTYTLSVEGGEEITNPKQIELIAESRDGTLEGFDTVKARIVNMTVNKQAVVAETRSVPGASWIQMLWLLLTATTFYYFIQVRP